ncbi:keratinocyte-associated protein [Anaeramoeba ignava]|uniref:Keratinocyte-associated protein n=1 Tax=Anaeramoeba ignava TaxID=1746090 RepID=A0A9Q0LFC1_ANAIG|nr:keratinocyte-associated protein [Anaeramoeba ignava]
MNQKSPTQSIVTSLISWVSIFALLRVASSLVGISIPFYLLAGVLSSFIFIITLILIGNTLEIFGWQINWFWFIFSLFNGLIVAFSIHRISLIICLLSSLVEFYFLRNISEQIYSKDDLKTSKKIKSKKQK